jgi:hypothetical protein
MRTILRERMARREEEERIDVQGPAKGATSSMASGGGGEKGLLPRR